MQLLFSHRLEGDLNLRGLQACFWNTGESVHRSTSPLTWPRRRRSAGTLTVGENSRILFGAVLTAEGGPVEVGSNCIIMENAVLRGTPRHPARVGDHVLVGPRAYLTGCTVEENVFLATGSTIFNGAVVGAGSEVRVNGAVHLKTVLPAGSVVPINWIAVGDPAEILPPEDHERVWSIQEPLNFPRTVFGVERAPAETMMPAITRRYTRALVEHRNDEIPETW